MPEVAPAPALLASELKSSAMRLTRRLRNQRAGDEISHSQFTVLALVARRGPQNIGQLSASEAVKPPSMNRTVNCLVDAGLVTRRVSPTDGRVVVVEATAEGAALVTETQQLRNAWLAERLAELTPGQRTLLHEAAQLMGEIASR